MFQPLKVRFPEKTLTALCLILVAGAYDPGRAATLCVNPAGSSGCQATIGAAVKAAAAGDTIQVAAGTYKEDVAITQSLSLIGANSATTIIDATGLSNGIFIDGTATAPKPGVSGVVVTGFTIQNANFQGMLVQNASGVTIVNNQVLSNDKSLMPSATPHCSGLPAALQAGEALDCGEGIHLVGVDHSVVSNNIIQNNSGGILISDETGPTHDNIISGNLVTKNPFDCGITLASHGTAGVYHNTISGNQSIANGLMSSGGAGVGLFAPSPGTKTYGNVVINNVLTGNGQPGVTMHNHAAPPAAPAINLDDNVIIGNTISGNAPDNADAATSGSTGISIFSKAAVNGTVVAENTIGSETLGLVFNAPGQVSASLNNFMDTFGVINSGAGTVNATQNYWGCSGGPTVLGCSGIVGSVVTSAWLTSPFNATQLPASGGTPPPGGGTAVTIIVTGPGGGTSTTNTFQTTASLITLDASHSTSSNPGALTYSWTVPMGFPSVSMTGGNTATPTIQLGSQGTYQFTLTVTDTTGATATATVTVQFV